MINGWGQFDLTYFPVDIARDAEVARRGGNVARKARMQLEKETGQKSEDFSHPDRNNNIIFTKIYGHDQRDRHKIVRG